MTNSIKKASAILMSIALVLSVTYISCNKDSNATATTIIKCVTCLNGGQCINDSCHCPTGYSGYECETSIAESLVGAWNIRQIGSAGDNENYQTTIGLESSFGTSQIYFQTLNQNYDLFDVQATVVGDSVYISNYNTGSYTINGVGYIHSGAGGANTAITISYEILNSFNNTVIDDFGYISTDGTGPAQLTKVL